jgi:hypothetical protein
MVRDVLNFLITLAAIVFLIGLGLGLWLGFHVGMTFHDTAPAALIVVVHRV